ncbi:UDP-galactopyranose mutase [Caproiciproducens sp.]|uniref:UDP-galactopyranose mutase n=1 Tax=Caproiciproducens sp. TaxID=1954376 RepID=UPI0028981437|nr:UDP-galactopyranose mutase [Caproiciproducens sp.]
MYDYIVVGAGFCGSVIARKIAEELGKKVLVLEKRKHIAGNMYDEFDEYGILVQRYGPHTFVTNQKELAEFVKKYGEWRDYDVTARVEIDGNLMPIPFNFRSIELFYGKEKSAVLIDKLKKAFPGQARIPVYMLTDNTDPAIQEYGKLLFEKDYIPYTSKQWGIPPEKIDRSVIARVQIALSYDEKYMQQTYQMMPEDGFTKIFHNILNHKNINVQTGTDALDMITADGAEHRVLYNGHEIPVIYTGPIDELFGLKYGRLPYRSLDIVFQTKDMDYFQSVAFIAYPQANGYTRSCEYKYLTGQKVNGKTTLSIEYPLQYDPNALKGNIPYYPVINDENRKKYQQYKNLADKFQNLYVCGRLGDYKYYNMDAAIERALEVFNQIKA